MAARPFMRRRAASRAAWTSAFIALRPNSGMVRAGPMFQPEKS